MRLCWTNAPSAYDYGYTNEVIVEERDGKPTRRLVTIPDESYDYQTARYGSGLYFVTEAKVST